MYLYFRSYYIHISQIKKTNSNLEIFVISSIHSKLHVASDTILRRIVSNTKPVEGLVTFEAWVHWTFTCTNVHLPLYMYSYSCTWYVIYMYIHVYM